MQTKNTLTTGFNVDGKMLVLRPAKNILLLRIKTCTCVLWSLAYKRPLQTPGQARPHSEKTPKPTKCYNCLWSSRIRLRPDKIYYCVSLSWVLAVTFLIITRSLHYRVAEVAPHVPRATTHTSLAPIFHHLSFQRTRECRQHGVYRADRRL